MLTERQPRLGPVLHRGQARLLHPVDVRRQRRDVTGVRERRATPQPERLTKQGGGTRVVPPRNRSPSLHDHPLKLVHIDVPRLDHQPVSPARPFDRRVHPIQLGDQPGARHHPPGVKEQQRQQGAQLLTLDSDLAPVFEASFERAQHTEPHTTDDAFRTLRNH